MSKLGLYIRPIVLFDPGNKLHRQWVTRFLETGSWGDCPVRFTIKEDHGNLLGHIQRELIIWYSRQEKRGRIATDSKTARRRSAGLTGGGFELTV